MLGEDRFRYDPNHYLISTVGLPTLSQIDVASSEEPYLGKRLILDPAVVTSTMGEAGLVHRQNDSGPKAIAVSALDPDLLNACLRLVRLLQMPEQYRVLGPLVIREIVYRLLIGEQGQSGVGKSGLSAPRCSSSQPATRLTMCRYLDF